MVNYSVDPCHCVHSSLGEQPPHALHGFRVFGLFTSLSCLVFLLTLMILCYIYAPFCASMLHKKE